MVIPLITSLISNPNTPFEQNRLLPCSLFCFLCFLRKLQFFRVPDSPAREHLLFLAWHGGTLGLKAGTFAAMATAWWRAQPQNGNICRYGHRMVARSAPKREHLTLWAPHGGVLNPETGTFDTLDTAWWRAQHYFAPPPPQKQ